MGTKIEPEVARRMYVEQGMSTHMIAKELGCTNSGVYLCLKRQGVQLRDRSSGAQKRTEKALGFIPTKEWLEQAMAAFGGNALACAEHYGFHYSTFVGVLERHGIARLPPEDRGGGAPRVEIPVDEAVKLSNEGWTYEDIAARFNTTFGVIQRRMQEVGHVAPKGKNRRSPPGRTLTPSKWKVFQELKKTEGDSCRICPESRTLDLCHIHGRKNGGPVVTTNCILLCPTHHRLFDSGSLTQVEFEKIKSKVRLAEQVHGFVFPHYSRW